MRRSAKHMMLVSMLFPAFLLLGCDNAVTGPQPLDEAPTAEAPEAEVPGEPPGQSVNADGCFEYDGQRYCPSRESPNEFEEEL